jgi:hypothetical protein
MGQILAAKQQSTTQPKWQEVACQTDDVNRFSNIGYNISRLT